MLKGCVVSSFLTANACWRISGAGFWRRLVGEPRVLAALAAPDSQCKIPRYLDPSWMNASSHEQGKYSDEVNIDQNNSSTCSTTYSISDEPRMTGISRFSLLGRKLFEARPWSAYSSACFWSARWYSISSAVPPDDRTRSAFSYCINQVKSKDYEAYLWCTQLPKVRLHQQFPVF